MVQGEFIQNFTAALMHTTGISILEGEATKKSISAFIDHCKETGKDLFKYIIEIFFFYSAFVKFFFFLAESIDKSTPVIRAHVFFTCVHVKIDQHVIFFLQDAESLKVTSYCKKQVNATQSINN